MRRKYHEKPYDPAPIRPNWDAKSVHKLLAHRDAIQTRNAQSASDAIKRLKAARKHPRAFDMNVNARGEVLNVYGDVVEVIEC